MRYLLTLLLFACCAATHAQPQKVTSIAFKDVSVVTMENDRVLSHQTVVVSNGVITSVVDQSKAKIPKDAIVVDGKGKFLMPGLAEMHAHVPPVDDLTPMKRVLTLFAANGITTIRGMLGHPRHLELREKLRAGEIDGPRFYTTGPSFNGNSVTSPVHGANMVREQKKAGYDFLKLHPGLTRAKFDSIAETANKLSIPFVGHVSYDVGVYRAIEARYSSIDHLDGFVESLVPDIASIPEQQAGPFGLFLIDKVDESRIPKLIQSLKAGNVAVVPTQSLAERWFHPDYLAEDFRNDPESKYMDPQVVGQWIGSKNNLANNPAYDPAKVRKFVDLRRRLIKACHDGGVQLLLGCDAPQVFNVPGFSTHHELEYLVQSGLTPYEAIKTGTVNVARYLKIPNGGVVKAGAVSDLVLLGGNPLSDIKQTQNIAAVLIGTSWWTKDYIDSELTKLKTK